MEEAIRMLHDLQEAVTEMAAEEGGRLQQAHNTSQGLLGPGGGGNPRNRSVAARSGSR